MAARLACQFHTLIDFHEFYERLRGKYLRGTMLKRVPDNRREPHDLSLGFKRKSCRETINRSFDCHILCVNLCECTR
jgi:hypothetical protein